MGWSSHCRSSINTATCSTANSWVSSPFTTSGTAKESGSGPRARLLQRHSKGVSLRLGKFMIQAGGDLAHELGQTTELSGSHCQYPPPMALGQLAADLQQTALPDASLAERVCVAACAKTVVTTCRSSSRPNRPNATADAVSISDILPLGQGGREGSQIRRGVSLMPLPAPNLGVAGPLPIQLRPR